MPSIENRMVMDSAWASYERRAEMLNEGHDHDPEPGPVECEDCGQLITHGAFCRSCCYAEIEALMLQAKDYLATNLERAEKQNDMAIMTGILLTTVKYALHKYFKEAAELSKEVGDNA